MPACSTMEEIVFSPELTVPDTWVLQNLADDIQRHKELKGASKIDRDEGYSSANSNAKEAVNSAWIPYVGSHCEPLLPIADQMTDTRAKYHRIRDLSREGCQ